MPQSEQQRLGVVVVTHGQLAHELVNAAEMITGELVRVEAVALGWHDDPNAARDQIAAAIARVDGPGGVLILTDMFGGTPSNLGITFLDDDRVEVLTGVNLPMLVKLVNLARTDAPLLTIARQVREHAREAIRVASDLMRPESVDEARARPDAGKGPSDGPEAARPRPEGRGSRPGQNS